MKQIDISTKTGVGLTTIRTMLDGKPISVKCAKAIAEVMGLNYKKSFEPVKRKSVSAATAKRYHALISTVFTHAVYQNIIPVNPCRVLYNSPAPARAVWFWASSHWTASFPV